MPPKPTYNLYIRRPDGAIVNLGLAAIDGGSAFTTIDKAHAQIHNGVSYTGGKVGVDLGAGASTFIAVKNNTVDKTAHFLMDFSFSTESIVRIFNGIEDQSGGSLEGSTNRKTGAVDSGIQIYWGATLDSGVSAFKETYSPGGSGPFAAGGELPFASEHVLLPGEWMAWEIENANSATMDYYGAYWDFYLAPAG